MTLVLLWFACVASFGSGPSNPSERARSEPAISLDTARRVLDLEARIGPVSEAQRWVLDTVMSDVCARVQPSTGFGSTARRGERRRAEAILADIDAVLLRHGFVYPDVGGVDRLTDALTPFTMTVERRAAFEAHAYNQRRKAMIGERFPGPFFPLDCDTASFLYLGIADRLGLPLRLVVIPSHGRRPGHAFVRWRGPDFFVNWETGMGAARRDEDYVREWRISRREIEAGAALVDLTDDQVSGCLHYLAALRYQRRRETGLALAELARARELFPQHLDIRREAAWRMATVAEPRSRQDAQAIDDARYVVRLADDADARDTLAAAYASAGLYAEAIREARAAIASSAEFAAARSGYRERLALYRRGRPYREFDAGRSAVPSASFTP